MTTRILEVSNKIRDAYLFAYKNHQGQRRKYTQEEYITHPEYVACLVSTYTDDEDVIMSALLHDIVEDTHVEIKDIIFLFGDRAGALVHELTTDERKKVEFGKRKYLTDKMNIMSEEALLVKLADRLHNVHSLCHRDIPQNFVEWYLSETKYILDNLDRKLNKNHIHLINLLSFTIFNIEFDKNI